MQVETILQSKGRAVTTVSARSTLAEAVAQLNTHRIGAVVVTENGRVVGILSERDIVRHLGDEWTALASRRVADIMTRDVVSTTPSASVNEVMELMTARRIRHLPVLEAGELIGIISIGDVVKHKIEATEREAQALREYITS